MTDNLKVSALEVYAAYNAMTDLKVSGLEVTAASSKRYLAYSGLEAQAHTIEPSDLEAAGFEVQAWISNKQKPSALYIHMQETRVSPMHP